MSLAGWYTNIPIGLYATTMFTAVTANAACLWIRRGISSLAVLLQMLTGLIGLLVGLLYGSPLFGRLIDGLAGIPGIHISVRESLFLIGAVCAQSVTALWDHRRFPTASILATCSVGATLLTALALTTVQSRQRGQPFGVHLSRHRGDVAAYYVAFYLYVIYTGYRFTSLGRLGASRLGRLGARASRDEILAVRGMRSITIGATVVMGFAVAHLIVVVSLFAGATYNVTPLFNLGIALYLVADLFYVTGMCYPAPARAWAERKERQRASV